MKRTREAKANAVAILQGVCVISLLLGFALIATYVFGSALLGFGSIISLFGIGLLIELKIETP